MARRRFTRERFAARSKFNDTAWGRAIRAAVLPGEVKLDRPTRQHPWIAGAVRLAAQMLASVPFVVVREDRAAAAALQRELREARDFDALRLARQKLDLLRKGSPYRARDAAMACHLRAPETPIERLPGHWAQRLFDRPNANLARAELWEAIVTFLLEGGEKGGNALLVFSGKGVSDKLKTPKSEPAEIRVFSRSGWRYELSKAGELEKWVLQTADGRQHEFEPHEVVQLRLFSGQDPIWGASPLDAAETHILLDLYATAWNQAFFESGAEPGAVLTTDAPLKPGSKEIQAIRDMWEARHQGVGRAHRTAVLTHGLKVQHAPTNQRDMEYLGMLEWDRNAALASLAGFHKAALGATEDLNYATIREARRMTWTNLLLPLAAYIEDVLYARFFERYDDGQVWGMFDVSGVFELQEDLRAKAETFQILLASQVSRNEANEVLGMGLPEVEWGDEPLVPAGLVPVSVLDDPLGPGPGAPPDQPGDAPGADPAGGAPDDGDGRALPPPEVAATGDAMDSGGQRADPARLPLHPQHRRPQVQHATNGQLAASDFWSAWWRAVGSQPEKGLRTEFRRYLRALREEQLRVIKDAAGGRAIRADAGMDAFLFDPDEWGRKLFDTTSPFWQEAARLAIADLEAELGGLAFTLDDPAWQEFLRVKEVKVRDINETMREALRTTLREGVSAGENVTQLQDRVRQSFRGFAQPYRTLRVARTEVAQAANGVRHMAMKAEGIATVQWITSNDDVVRASHQDYEAAGPQPINVNWVTLSPYSQGSHLSGPSDVAGHPAEIVNCRCVLVPGD